VGFGLRTILGSSALRGWTVLQHLHTHVRMAQVLIHSVLVQLSRLELLSRTVGVAIVGLVGRLNPRVHVSCVSHSHIHVCMGQM
jgi:hypothetical protein